MQNIGLSLGINRMGGGGSFDGPYFDLDFTTQSYTVNGSSMAFADVFDYSNATSGTPTYYVNSSGNFINSSAAARVLHHRWNGSSFVPAGIRLEPLAQQKLNSTSNFTTDWTSGTRHTITTTLGTIAGLTSARFAGTGVAGFEAASYTNTPNLIGNTIIYTQSALVKYVSGSGWIVMYAADLNASGGVWFNLNTGTVGTQQANVLKAGMLKVADGWIVWLTCTSTSSSGSQRVQIAAVNSDGGLSPNTGTFDMAYMQVEATDNPTFYMPRNTAVGTTIREPDSLQIKSALVPTTPTGFAMMIKGHVEFYNGNSIYQTPFIQWGLTGTTPSAHMVWSSSTDVLETRIASNAPSDTATYRTTIGSGLEGGDIEYNMAMTVREADGALSRQLAPAVNSTTTTTTNTWDTGVPLLGDMSNLPIRLGGLVSSGFEFTGSIEKVKIWTKGLTDVEAAAEQDAL